MVGALLAPSGLTRRTTFIFDPLANEWMTGADMPTAREHFTAAGTGEFIYVIGGRNGPATSVMERYDPATDTWATLTPMPTARSAAATAALRGRIYVAGGEVPMLFAVHEVYDIATDTWSTAEPMPIPRHGVAAVTLDDRVFVPAGGIVQGIAPTNAVDSFVPLLSGPVPTVSARGAIAMTLLLLGAGAALLARRSAASTR